MGWQTDGESNRAGEETESSLCVKQKKRKSLKWKKKLNFDRVRKTLRTIPLTSLSSQVLNNNLDFKIFLHNLFHVTLTKTVSLSEVRQVVLFPFHRLGSRSSVPRVTQGEHSIRENRSVLTPT